MPKFVITDHEKRGNTRHLVVTVTPDGQDATPVEEVFDYGMDVKASDVLREVKALLLAKYAPTVSKLPNIGDEI